MEGRRVGGHLAGVLSSSVQFEIHQADLGRVALGFLQQTTASAIDSSTYRLAAPNRFQLDGYL